MFEYPTVDKFSAESGYTAPAIRAKISDGTWQEDHQWIKAPDGRVLIIVEGIKQWVEAGLASKQRLKVVSRSPSCLKTRGAVKESSLSPLPLI